MAGAKEVEAGTAAGAATVRAMVRADWPGVARVYADGISTGDATFEMAVPGWAEWDSAHLDEPRLVAIVNREIGGWAALSAVSSRCFYEGVAEVSVYVGATARGRGVGTALLAALVEAAEALGIWTLQAGIFPENSPSLRVHERCGFRVVGTRERIGRMDGRWRDVLLLERRSPVIS